MSSTTFDLPGKFGMAMGAQEIYTISEPTGNNNRYLSGKKNSPAQFLKCLGRKLARTKKISCRVETHTFMPNTL
jgi:hypothetical protein